MSFDQLGLSQPLLDALLELGFEQPTPIQEEAIPFLLQGERDLVGLAQTGTGKTAAFGLPLIDKLDAQSTIPNALVLAPTRELCLQISKELNLFAQFRPLINITSVYGGADIRAQIRALKNGSQLVVATPGRLRDLIRRKAIKLEAIKMVVLDEADEMLNMGFKEEIDEILEQVPEERRTWLFSATMPPSVARLAKNYMHEPHQIKVGNTNETNQDINHQFILARPRERQEILRRYLDTDADVYALVFCRTRAETLTIADELQKDGYAADVLNGDLSQDQRDRAMNRFRSKRVRVLIATDVAARGLDVDGITHVFHFNIPDDWAFYTHRAGRTGRAGKQGESIMIIHPNDRHKLRALDRKLNLGFQETEPPSALGLVEKRLRTAIEQVATTTPIAPLQSLLENITFALDGLTKEELIERLAAVAFSELPNHYQREALQILDPSAYKHEKKQKSAKSSGKYQRLFLNVGRKEVAGVREFIDFLAFFGEIDPKTVGEVNLQEKHTFFEVDQKIARSLVNRFKGANWEGRALRMNFDSGPDQERKSKKSRRKGSGNPRNFKKKRRTKR